MNTRSPIRRNLLLCLLLFGMNWIPMPVLAAAPAGFFRPETALGFFWNAGRAYEGLVKAGSTLQGPEGAERREQLEELWKAFQDKVIRAGATARTQRCRANLQILRTAMAEFKLREGRELSAAEPLSVLAEKKFLAGNPTCPDGGEYVLTAGADGNLEAGCSHHGSGSRVEGDPSSGETAGFPIERMTFSELLSWFQKWHQKGLFRPTGGLWLAIDRTMNPRVAIEAEIRPQELVAWVRSLAPVPLPEVGEPLPEGGLAFLLPAVPGEPYYRLEIRKNGARFGPAASFSGPPGEGWKDFLAFAGTPDPVMALDLEPAGLDYLDSSSQAKANLIKCQVNLLAIRKAIELSSASRGGAPDPDGDPIPRLVREKVLTTFPKCPDQGRYLVDPVQTATDSEGSARSAPSWRGGHLGPSMPLVTCSVHGTQRHPAPAPGSSILSRDPRWRAMGRITVRLSPLELQITAQVTDPAVLDNLKTTVDGGLGWIRLLAMGPEAASYAPLLEPLNHVVVKEEGGRLSIRLPTPAPEALANGATGFLRTMALPGLLRDRQEAAAKACFANRAVLAQALEMYHQEHGKPMEGLDTDRLFREKLIDRRPACPEGGVLSCEGDPGKAVVKCSVHDRPR